MCAPLPGGYCASPCGATGSACDGACVETARGGEVCAAACKTDDDCRKAEGYVCDAQWHACLIPNTAAIIPAQCPAAPKVPAQDTSFSASEAWSSDKTPGIYQLEPSAVVTADGGLTALYMTRGSMMEGNVLAISRVDGKGVRSDSTLDTGRANAFDPWLARDRKGTLYAVWLGFDTQESAQQIGFATSTDHGTTWSKPIAVQDPGDCAAGGDGEERDCLDKPMVVASDKAIYVMYASGDNGLRVRASRDGGTTFAPPVTAMVGIYGNAAIGSDGKLHLVTINGGPHGSFGSAQQTIEYTVSGDGGALFAQPVPVSGRDELLPFFFSNPSIAVDTKRKWIYVAYVRGGRDAKWEIVLASSKNGGVTWSRQKLAGDGCAIHMVPNLALDEATGILHIAYYDSEGARGRFVHARCGVGGTRCSVLGAINTQPFATLSTERHGSKWIGEYEALAIDPKRKLLHAVWAQPVAEGDKQIARIFHAQAKLPAK